GPRPRAPRPLPRLRRPVRNRLSPRRQVRRGLARAGGLRCDGALSGGRPCPGPVGVGAARGFAADARARLTRPPGRQGTARRFSLSYRPPAVPAGTHHARYVQPCETCEKIPPKGETMNHQEMTDRIARGNGFIAALDQSGGSTPKALRAYGVADDEWSGDDEMFAQIHEMRCRIIRSPAFPGDKVVGAILFEKTMDGAVDGVPVPQALVDKGVAPFLKIDKGLEDEVSGVQLMKPMPGLDALL